MSPRPARSSIRLRTKSGKPSARARSSGARAAAKSFPGKRCSSHCSTSQAASGPSASSRPCPAVRRSIMPVCSLGFRASTSEGRHVHTIRMRWRTPRRPRWHSSSTLVESAQWKSSSSITIG